jgi:hypothetical protein
MQACSHNATAYSHIILSSLPPLIKSNAVTQQAVVAITFYLAVQSHTRRSGTATFPVFAKLQISFVNWLAVIKEPKRIACTTKILGTSLLLLVFWSSLPE